MNTKRLFVLALTLALVLAASAATLAFADEAVVPFKAYYAGVPVGVFDPGCGCIHQTFEFDGNATHLGLSHMSAQGNAYPYPPPIQQIGDMVLTAADGDELYVHYEGTAVYLSQTLVEFDGDFSFEGGTGRFLDVTGEGIYWGSASVAPSPDPWGKIYFDGTLYK